MRKESEDSTSFEVEFFAVKGVLFRCCTRRIHSILRGCKSGSTTVGAFFTNFCELPFFLC